MNILKMFAWLSIAFSPFLLGGILSVITYLVLGKGIFAIIIAILIGLLFLFLGIYFANKVSKKKGSIEFITQIRTTPELDYKKNDDEIENKILKNHEK